MNHLHRSVTYAEELRNKATASEIEMCRLLDANMVSYVFQSNICDIKTGRVYIADFRIRRTRIGRPKGMPKKQWKKLGNQTPKLFIEIDGGYHEGRRSYDAQRTRWIESHRDAIVLRFSNEDVWDRPGDVISKILSYRPAIRTTRKSITSRAGLGK